MRLLCNTKQIEPSTWEQVELDLGSVARNRAMGGAGPSGFPRGRQFALDPELSVKLSLLRGASSIDSVRDSQSMLAQLCSPSLSSLSLKSGRNLRARSSITGSGLR